MGQLIKSSSALILILMLVSLHPVVGETEELTFDYVGSSLWTGISDIETQGNYAYCTMPYGLVVIDFTDRTTPTEVGRLYLEGKTCGLDVSSDYACVISRDFGLQTVDISNPEAPTFLSLAEHSTPSYNDDKMDVTIIGSYAYCYGTNGLFIVDISDPGAPSEIYDTGSDLSFFDMCLDGSHAYLSFSANTGRGLMALDVSAPGAFVEVSRLPVSAPLRGIQVSEGKAYVAAVGDLSGWYDALYIVDVSNPAAMKEESSLQLQDIEPGGEQELILIDSYALIVDHRRGLATIDISDSESPTLVGIYKPDNRFAPSFITRVAEHAFLNSWSSRFEVLDISSPVAPVSLGQRDYAGQLSSLALDGDRVWVGDERGVLYEVDIVDPGLPSYSEYLDLSERYTIFDVKVGGDYAYVAQGLGLAICDLTDPEVAPRIELNGELTVAVAVRDTLLVAYADGPLFCGRGVRPRFFDISDPMAPVLQAFADHPSICVGYGGGLAIAGDYLYVAEQGYGPADGSCGGVHVVDMSIPFGPYYVSTVEPAGWATDVAVQGDLAYAVLGPGLTVLDITEPRVPVTLGSCSVGGWEMEVAGQVAFVATYRDSVAAVDISRPQRPEEMGKYHTNGEPRDVVANGDLLYVADDYGLTILRVDLPPGTCCLPDGSCVVSEQTACETDLGGTYNGVLGECLGDNNGNGVDDGCEPTGACCLPDFQCSVVLQTECEDILGGTYSGDDTECAGDLNDNNLDDYCEPTGACCLEDGSCVVANQVMCEGEYTLGGIGVYAGDDTECWGDLDENGTDDRCEPHGACCPGEGECLIATRNYCESGLEGSYAGDATECMGDTNEDGFDDACVPLTCCVGRVGDANGLGGDEPTIGDVSVIIDARFISGECDGTVVCPAEADINQSGGVASDCNDLTIGDVSILIDYLFISGPSIGLPDCI